VCCLFVFSTGLADEKLQKLIDAINTKDVVAAQKAIADGADVNGKNEQDYTPLHLAVVTCNLDIVNLLLENKADVNMKSSKALALPITAASTRKHLDIAKALIKSGANLKAKQGIMDMFTILEGVVASGAHIDVVKLLVKEGADPEQTDLFGGNAIIALARETTPTKRIEIVKKTKAECEAKGLPWGAYMDQFVAEDYSAPIEIAEYLVSEGADAKIKSRMGTALATAVQMQNIEYATWLVSKKVDPDVGAIKPMYYAVNTDNPDMIRLLIKAGADIDAKHYFPGGEAYVWKLNYFLQAAIDGKLEALKFLLETGEFKINDIVKAEEREPGFDPIAGVSYTKITTYTQTALSFAVEMEHTAVAEYLRSKGGKGPKEL
jgi:ankyrin repeat protein